MWTAEYCHDGFGSMHNIILISAIFLTSNLPGLKDFSLVELEPVCVPRVPCSWRRYSVPTLFADCPMTRRA